MEKRDRNLVVVKYSAYSSAILLFFVVLLYVLGKGFGLGQNILFIILGTEICLCCNEYKSRTVNPLSYKKAFAMGWQVSFFSGVLTSLAAVLFVGWIGTEKMLAYVNGYKSLLLMSDKQLAEPEVEEALRIMVNPWFVFFAINLFYLLTGFFLSILIAFFVRTPTTTYSNEE